jgi:hypothetical protein
MPWRSKHPLLTGYTCRELYEVYRITRPAKPVLKQNNSFLLKIKTENQNTISIVENPTISFP